MKQIKTKAVTTLHKNNLDIINESVLGTGGSDLLVTYSKESDIEESIIIKIK